MVPFSTFLAYNLSSKEGAQPTIVVVFSHPAKTYEQTFGLKPMRHHEKSYEIHEFPKLLLLLTHL